MEDPRSKTQEKYSQFGRNGEVGKNMLTNFGEEFIERLQLQKKKQMGNAV